MTNSVSVQYFSLKIPYITIYRLRSSIRKIKSVNRTVVDPVDRQSNCSIKGCCSYHKGGLQNKKVKKKNTYKAIVTPYISKHTQNLLPKSIHLLLIVKWYLMRYRFE